MARALLLVAVVAAGLVARLLLIGEPMRYDESFSFVQYASSSIRHIVTAFDAPNNHILGSLAEHAALKALGNHVWTVRVPSLVAGVALIAAVYLAARALHSRRAALWAAALTAGYAPLVDYSVNGRGYALGTLFTVTALWLAARLLDRPRRTREWIALGACFVLAVYSVPTFAFAVATVAGWMAAVVLLRRDRATAVRLALTLAASAGVAAALYIPTFGQAGWDWASVIGQGSGSVGDVAERVWDHWSRAVPHPLDWLVLAGFAVSLALHRRLARHPLPLVLPALAVPLAAVALDRAGPFERTWLYLLPLYLIGAGAGLAHLTERIMARVPRAAPAIPVTAVAVAVALAAAAVDHGETDPTQLPSSDNDIVGFLKRERQPGEAVVLDPASVAPASVYYLVRDHYTPPPLPRRGPATALLLIRRREGGPAGVRRLLASIHRRPAPAAPAPRLVRRLEYVEAWEARLGAPARNPLP